MKLNFLINSMLIIASTLLPFIWNNNPSTSGYTLQLCGALTILYIVFKKFLLASTHRNSLNTTTILFTNAITQLLVLSTGGIASPLFFLYYFLIFAFALIYGSTQAFTISLATVSVYLFETNFSPNTIALANLFSLILITPLAQSFSKTIIKNLEAEGKIKVLETSIASEEIDSLLWLSTEAKPTLNTVIKSATDLVIYLKSTRNSLPVPKGLLDKAKSIQSDLINLYTSTEALEASINTTADSYSNTAF